MLINGRQAEFVYTIIGGYLRLATRVGGYVLLMTGKYPPFGPGGEHTIDLTFDETEQQNRLWGIPIVGLWVRWILLIPHWIVLFFIGIVVGFVSLVTWIPVLVNGAHRRLGRPLDRRLLPLVQPRVCVRAAADRQVPAVPPGRLSRRQPWHLGPVVRRRGPPPPFSEVGLRRGASAARARPGTRRPRPRRRRVGGGSRRSG